MENSFRFELSHYYKQLQSIQKNLSITKSKHHKSPKTKPLPKLYNQSSTLINKYDKKRVYEPKARTAQARQIQLIIHKNRESLKLDHCSKKEVASNFLENIQETFISDHCQIYPNHNQEQSQNSIHLQQPNQNVVLEVYGFDLKDDKTVVRVGRSNKQSTQTMVRNKKQQLHKRSVKFQQNKCSKQLKIFNSQLVTQQLIQMLKFRNRIYNIVLKNCNQQSKDIVDQFQEKWLKLQYYQKFINKISSLLTKSTDKQFSL